MTRAATQPYFAFGANVHPATLARRGIVPVDARVARLDDHRLVFDQPGLPILEPSFASVRPCEGDRVWGVVYDLVPSELDRLRTFEGHAYDEVSVRVRIDERELDARAFVTRGRHRERPPSRRYLRLIRAGARHHGLPAEWVERLDAQPCSYLPVIHESWGLVFSAFDHVHRWLGRSAVRR